MQQPWQSPQLDADLLSRFEAGPERGGVILNDGSLVEMTNFGDEDDVCVLDPMELLGVEDRMVATWHTHPTTSAALSGMDWDTFTGWPDLLHCIVGVDGVRWYAVKGSAVVNA